MHITKSSLRNTPTLVLSNTTISGNHKSRTQQYIMYQIALHGGRAYTEENWNALDKYKKAKVITLFQKAQRSINLLKQEICFRITSKILSGINTSTPLIAQMISQEEYDDSFTNMISFKDLKIRQEMVVEKLIADRVFPKNYYEL